MVVSVLNLKNSRKILYKAVLSALSLALCIQQSACAFTSLDTEVAEVMATPEITFTTTPETTTPPPTTTTTPETTIATITEPAKIVRKISDVELFEQELDMIFQKYKTIGASLAVFADGEIVHIYNYGFEDKKYTPVSTDTKFRTASISKTMTAITVLGLVEQGKLDLDQPIGEILRVPVGMNATPKITTTHMLTHTSGIYDIDWDATPPLDYLYNNGFLRSHTAPGTTFAYSNTSYGIVGAIVETVTGKRFTDYTNEVLFDVLEIDAGFLIDNIDNRERLANVYENGILTIDMTKWNRTNEKYYEDTEIGDQHRIAQSEAYASAEDIAKIGIALAGDGEYQDKRIISDQMLEFMHTPYADAKKYAQGYGIRIYDGNVIADRTIYGHPGQAYGMVGGLYYDREENVGIALLTNGCSISTYTNSMYRMNDDVVCLTFDLLIDGGIESAPKLATAAAATTAAATTTKETTAASTKKSSSSTKKSATKSTAENNESDKKSTTSAKKSTAESSSGDKTTVRETVAPSPATTPSLTTAAPETSTSSVSPSEN